MDAPPEALATTAGATTIRIGVADRMTAPGVEMSDVSADQRRP